MSNERLGFKITLLGLLDGRLVRGAMLSTRCDMPDYGTDHGGFRLPGVLDEKELGRKIRHVIEGSVWQRYVLNPSPSGS